jgi:hypothetical protein
LQPGFRRGPVVLPSNPCNDGKSGLSLKACPETKFPDNKRISKKSLPLQPKDYESLRKQKYLLDLRRYAMYIDGMFGYTLALKWQNGPTSAA